MDLYSRCVVVAPQRERNGLAVCPLLGRKPMNGDLSANARAILLLTAPLLTGRNRHSARSQTGERHAHCNSPPRPLSNAEYRDFARALYAIRREPSALLASDSMETIHQSGTNLDSQRIRQLLGRGFLLALAIERWRSCALWVITRADPCYPRKLKYRMGGNAPPVLYGCGDSAILSDGGLAVVGSRNVDDSVVSYTEDIGLLAARAKKAVISGGARGVWIRPR